MTYSSHYSRGFTLLELLIAFTIIAITFGISFGSFSFIEKQRVEQNARTVIQAIMYARSLAIKENQSVFICASDNGSHCDKNWSNTMMIYRDLNGNKSFDTSDDMIHLFEIGSDDNRIRWGSFRRQDYLEFLPTGMTNFQNGTFTVCANNKNVETAVPVIVNVAGRPYFGRDSNNDGVREYSGGSPVQCS
ncbi:MAG: GspH/FimT family pseudopilin [Oleiphilaceae bacterium]|nr:GspH/FimT family pseudopilin [Oleiphilaceae bacterium]